MDGPKKGNKMADEDSVAKLAKNMPKHAGPNKGSGHKMADEIDKVADRVSSSRRGSHILPPHLDGD